jgi:hypothetical protein
VTRALEGDHGGLGCERASDCEGLSGVEGAVHAAAAAQLAGVVDGGLKAQDVLALSVRPRPVKTGVGSDLRAADWFWACFLIAAGCGRGEEAGPGGGSGQMRDGVPQLGCGRSFFGGWPRPGRAAGEWRELAASFIGSRARLAGVRGALGCSSGGLECLLPEFAQGVIAAAGELARRRQGGQPTGAPVAGGGVVAVVRSGRAGGKLGGLRQRPAQ